MMVVEVWELIEEDEEVVQITVIPKEYTEAERTSLLGPGTAKKLREIVGDTWEDVMRQHYLLMGWGLYAPMTRD